MNKNVNVLMTPSLAGIKEYIKQHSHQVIDSHGGEANFRLNDSIKVGEISMGSFLFDRLSNKKEGKSKVEDSDFIYFFRTQYLSTSDITVNYLSDFSEKYLIMLFVESDQTVVNSSQEEVQYFNKGPWVIFNTSDIAHQLSMPQNTQVKALSIFFSFRQLVHLFSENKDTAFYKLITEEHITGQNIF